MKVSKATGLDGISAMALRDVPDVCNYWPTPVLSVPSKIPERQVHTGPCTYLELHKHINPNQSGLTQAFM